MEVVVSAPGKVLLTGGYLVLERPNAGIVLSTTARFYAIVRPIYDEIMPDSWAWVAKTGLGSSAAMTTSVVASLLHYLGAVSIPLSGNKYTENGNGINSGLDLVHAIAQSAHCIAQGKIGSGFDVSSAVYGSQKYVRFSPQVLTSTQDSSWRRLPEIVSDVLKQKWDHENKPFSLPPFLTLLLGEPGTGGSSTPSMVGSVKKWQNSDPTTSQEIWQKLADSNSLLELQLKNLNKYSLDHYDSYKHVITACSRLPYNNWIEMVSDQVGELIVKSLLATREAFLQIRHFLCEMGKNAGVPVSLSLFYFLF
ncbi:putative phosphomevalonate kinase [Carex littledalei]|uniref:phosphomevalonate kinase n=1 Tax=Carex littledalei TaxID=544730 RepID=A0A833VI89_9POAL|nr:putative phosphomevalonate kinase [Carex littledalei]